MSAHDNWWMGGLPGLCISVGWVGAMLVLTVPEFCVFQQFITDIPYGLHGQNSRHRAAQISGSEGASAYVGQEGFRN